MGRISDSAQSAGTGSSRAAYDAHNHDTINHDDFATAGIAGLNVTPEVVDITASQKMMSAMSGSLLTSLLGMLLSHLETFLSRRICCANSL